MFMVLSSWQSHCESSPGSFDECRMAPSGRRPKTKPDDLGCESACSLQAARNYTHHRRPLSRRQPAPCRAAAGKKFGAPPRQPKFTEAAAAAAIFAARCGASDSN